MATAAPEDSPSTPKNVEGLGLLLRALSVAKHAALALALTASAVLFIDYKNAGDPAFCGVASGCFAVRVSAYSQLGGVPLPALALPAFGVLFVGSLLARSVDHHRVVGVVAGVGGLCAAALIAIQAWAIGAFCQWCVIVDSSALLAAGSAIAIALVVGKDDDLAASASARPAGIVAWGIAGALGVAAPFVWARYPVVPPPPPEIAAEQTPGTLTIVAFTDFECPYCRKLHPILDEVVRRHPDRVRVVRKMNPLGGHPGAMPAAKAYVCAPESKREAVADHLYHAESADLSNKKIAGLAEKLDLGSREAFAACLDSEATAEAIERDSKLFARLGGRGLPYTWVGGHVILGANGPRLGEVVEAQLGGPRPTLPVSAMFVVVGLAIAAAAAVAWRSSSSPAPAVQT